MRADGGAAANNFLMQFQADLLNVPVDRPRDIESTAIGAALFAGLGAGINKDLKDLSAARASDVVFKPTAESAEIKRIESIKAGWLRAVRAVQVFADSERSDN